MSTGDDLEIATKVPAWMPTLKTYDQTFADFTSNLMPARDSPEPGRNDSFHWEVRVAPQRMAPRGDLMSKARFGTEARAQEVFWTAITLEGMRILPDQYSNEVLRGNLGPNMTEKLRDVMEAIQRRIAYDRLKFICGDSTTVSRFSSMSTERRKLWDVSSDTYMSSGKGGSWSTVSTDILWHVDYINRYPKVFGTKKPLNNLLIGPDTEFYMNQNTTLRDLLKYNVDLRGMMFNGTIRNLKVETIMGDTYKAESDESGFNTPGMGSHKYDIAGTMVTKHMMRENFGGTEYEFALLTADNIGFTWRPEVYTAEGYPTGNLVTVSWQDHNPLLKYAYVMTRYGFAMEDFAYVHKLQKIAATIAM